MNQFSVSPAMVARYVLNREKELELLKDSLNSKDFSMLAAKAHNLKGTAESFGFPELGVVGQRLEEAALANNESGILEQIQKIEDWVCRCLQK